ncbi:disease resistance protein RGA5 isoform X2 [Setaria viridis]|uniref:disease resistance protein RGA5 isoform X2 n=1 Tax=Setaria viridis TaxID=4556 RepID=UPI001493C3EB|nr:disease resistance protein RGA5-like isoform X2 [Setaria viridis]
MPSPSSMHAQLLGLQEISSMEDQTRPLDGTIWKLPGKLSRLLCHGCILPKGVENEIPLIKHDLEEILAILSNLDDDHAMMVRCWRKEVRELSYDIEDFINQYEHAKAGSWTGSIPRRKIIQRHNSRTTLYRLREKLRHRLWIANKIREFSVRSQEVLQRHSMYNLNSIAGSSSRRCAGAHFTSSHPTPCWDGNTPIGISATMDKLEERLMKMYDEGHQKLKVVSIVGFGGIGKTTLANELYRKLGRQFECRAFLRTSQKPDMRRILISMLSQVRPQQSPDNWTVHSLISTIRTHLQDKRYFVIVEDLWATSTWDILKCALPDDSCCSRILMTTEIEDLALQSCGYDPNYIFKLNPLGEDDSRKLFFSSVFGPQQECPPEHREVYCDIIRKCGGLPLAIVTIASIFAGQLNVKEQMDYLNKSLGCSLITNATLEGIKQVIDLSYNNLPQHLKACILYTGLYEEDIIIWRDDLVNQWIAEGFICATGGQDKQEISRAYFDELVGRKMIQPVHTNDNGEVLSCVVHYMVLNLIVTYKSMEENFITVVHHSQANSTLADKVRRLSLHFGNAEDVIPPSNMRLSQVRTLVYFGVCRCMPYILQFHLLQVLILHFWGDKDNISWDLTRISELFRLRYLMVSSNVTLDLRTQMHGLQYLETLKIDARVRAVPSDIVHLSGLLNLSLPTQTNLPSRMGHMTSLRTLEYFDLSTNTMENVQSLITLSNLRELQLTCSTVQPENLNNKMQFLLNSIGRLSNLTSLNLVPRTSSCANSLDDAGAASITVSDSISSMPTPTLLQSLEVSPRICIFLCLPKWIGQLCKLCTLKVGVRKLARNDIDVLRGMPLLAVLSLYVHTKPASRIVIGKTGFPVIRYFKFKCCDPLLKFEEDAMPHLRKLKLVFNAHSADLQSTIPVGIDFLSELKEFSVKIGGAGPDKSHRRAAELAIREAIMVHGRCQRVNVRCVQHIIGGKEGQSCITTHDDHDSYEHDEIMPDNSGQEVLCAVKEAGTIPLPGKKEGNNDADNRKRRKTLVKDILTSSSDGDDGHSWRKYGQKEIPGSKHPRAYFRCTDRHSIGCNATKQVQRTDGDPNLFAVRYYGEHTCDYRSETTVRVEMEQSSITELGVNSVNPSTSSACSTSSVSSRRSMIRGNVKTSKPDDDGYFWKEYVREDILGAKYPRSYYHCVCRHTEGCRATKQVQRTDADPLVFDVIYNGEHTCKQTAHFTDENKSLSVPLDPPTPGLSEMLSAEDTAKISFDKFRGLFNDDCPIKGKIDVDTPWGNMKLPISKEGGTTRIKKEEEDDGNDN